MAIISKIEIVNNLYNSYSKEYNKRPKETCTVVKPWADSINFERDGWHRPSIWMVEVGEEYKAIRFMLDGQDTGYWFDSDICVPVDTSEEECNLIAEKVVSEISDEELNAFNRFISYIKRNGI